jgi:Tol biopolymer transport system component
MLQVRLGLTLVAAVSLTATATTFAPFALPSASAYLEDPAFTPDGQKMYVTLVNGASHTIVVSNLHAGSWSQPQVASFSGRWRDLEEVLSPDGKTMIFASNRPLEGEKPIDGNYGNQVRPGNGGNLWRTSWNGTSWSDPVPLPASVNANTSTYTPALAADGTLYFMQASGPKADFHIFVSRPQNGTYTRSELAPFSDMRYSDFDPAVAPDGSFVIFTSNRPPSKSGTSGLFVTFFHNGWTTPRYIGATIAPDGAIEPRLSGDLKTLYFTHRGQLWRADIAGVEGLQDPEP